MNTTELVVETRPEKKLSARLVERCSGIAEGYGDPQGTAANKCILVQTNKCGCKQIYIDTKIIKHCVKLTNVAAN